MREMEKLNPIANSALNKKYPEKNPLAHALLHTFHPQHCEAQAKRDAYRKFQDVPGTLWVD
jgi:hypothetical protein